MILSIFSDLDDIMTTLLVVTLAAWACLALVVCDLQSNTSHLVGASDQEVTIYVDKKNVNNSQCWPNANHSNLTLTCLTIDAALEEAQGFTSSNTSIIIVLSSGIYYLGLDSNLSTFENVQDLSIVGANGTTVVVDCNHSNGFAFLRSRNIKLENLNFNKCQTNTAMPKELAVENSHTEIGLAFYNSADVRMVNVTVSNTNGIAVLFYNTMGNNIIAGCSFLNNNLYHNLPENESTDSDQASGGLSIYFKLSVRDSNYSECLYHNSSHRRESFYNISDCIFSLNDASEVGIMEPRSPLGLHRFQKLVSKGGGLSLLFYGHAINNLIHIHRSIFEYNNASWGGGAHVCFRDYSKCNHVLFKDCLFDSNSSPRWLNPGGSHGGGADVIYFQHDAEDVQNNMVKFQNCNFSNNYALFGGGLALQVSEIQGKNNSLYLVDSVFTFNKANVGAALDLSVSYLTSQFGQTTGHTSIVIDDCDFIENSVEIDSTGSNQAPRIGNGAVYIYKVQALFMNNITFTSNGGTALVLAAWVQMLPYSHLIFRNNSGIFGGALRFTDQSRLQISNGTSLEFLGNKADFLGGGIFAESTDVHSKLYQTNCFLHYQEQDLNPDLWNTTFTFVNNTNSNKKNSIWSNTLASCHWFNSSSSQKEINRTFCWDNWHYVNSDCHCEVSSGGTRFVPVSTSTPTVFPGISTSVPFQLEDDLGNDVSSNDILRVQVIHGEADLGNRNSLIKADSTLKIFGIPNSTARILLQTLGYSGFIQEYDVDILPCPPGFTLSAYILTEPVLPVNATLNCVCENDYFGSVRCNQSSLTATLLDGYSMSYDETAGMTVVGAIPYITYGARILPQSVSELDEVLCRELNRTGLLCSQCTPGLSVLMGFSSLHCIDCKMGLVSSWLIFGIEQLLPSTLFFLLIILCNINAASAPFNGYVIFSQVISVPLQYRLVSGWILSIDFYNAHQVLINIALIPYSVWNLDFKILYAFHRDVCFLTGNHILAHIAFEYINAIFPLLFIGASYALIELHSFNFKPVVWLWRPFRACFLRFKHTWNPKLSVINAFATFIIVSYIEFITTSVKLLSYVKLYSSNSVVGNVHYFDASIPYFGQEHLPYALLAVCVLLTFVLLPPLLMFVYPLKIVQKCIGKLNCKRCFQSLRIFVDAFQGSFKDRTNGTRDCRFFSGLYFVFRIILILIYGVVDAVPVQYLSTISLLLAAILLLALVRPYKNDYYNKVDIAIFVLMLLIHLLDFFNTHVDMVVGYPLSLIWAVRMFFSLLPLLYIVIKCIQLVWRKCKAWKRNSRRTIAFLEKITPSKSFKPHNKITKRRRKSLVTGGKPHLQTISEVTISNSNEFPDRVLNPQRYEPLENPQRYEPLENPQRYKPLKGYGNIQNGRRIFDNHHNEPTRENDRKHGHSRPFGEANTWTYGALKSNQDDKEGIMILDSQEMEAFPVLNNSK